MMKVFPQNFDLRNSQGSRPKQFALPQDAFQQLVGDALQETTGPYAHISPTKGQDGSIDAFVETGGVLAGPFQDLPLPLIVECKAHDDTVKDLRKNIFGEWARVKGKLESNAQAGWQNLFQPWTRARGYAYCISAVLPSKQIRVELTEAIQTFFASLPAIQRPPIESVRVIDWNDLRQWLETLPHVSDAWLGIQLELILDHASFLKRLDLFFLRFLI
jgi:hypothetical protein